MTDPSTRSGQDRRFIEESFPVKEVSAISAKETYARHGHIKTLHVWWARRPLASSRATAYAALVPAPAFDFGEDSEPPIVAWQRRRDFIVELSRWENSLNQPLLEKARRDIYQAHAERLSAERGEPVTVEDIEAGRVPPPRVLDPFAGGGAIPLEALRLGCETYASDYNPVAVLILKATLEYPQKYGTRTNTDATDTHGFSESIREHPSDPRSSASYQPGLFEAAPQTNPLLEAVKKWGDWVLEEARKELAEFYPPDPDGSIPVGYIWARTIPCQNPACGTEIPLMRQFWLAKKAKKKVALWLDRTRISADATDTHGFSESIRANPSDPRSSACHFKIVGDGYEPWPEGFDPSQGTVSRAVATCPVCGGMVEAKSTHRLFREGEAGQQMVVVVLKHPRRRGKNYRLAAAEDVRVFREAEAALQEKRTRLMLEWGMDPVPNEPLPPKASHRAVGSQLPLYGFHTWGDLFNDRQKLALITFADKVRLIHKGMVAKGIAAELATAVTTYLALAVDRLATRSSNFSVWHRGSEGIEKIYARQALPMQYEYPESNVLLSDTVAGFWQNVQTIMSVLEQLVEAGESAAVTQASATQLAYPDDYFDAVFTDPPYYDNVPYSYLSDFFYVWLKRTVGHLYPDLFSTPLTPKSMEIVAYAQREGGSEAANRFFESNLRQAFQETYRVLKREGTAVIVYAHKSTAGWETVINALLDSGLVTTGAWPLQTEMEARLTARETASLSSSIYIIARKMARQPTGFYNEVREELRRHLDRKLQRLWEEGIGGADFFIAAIGSAIEVFGQYEQVMDYEGHVVRADRLLEDVRTIATDYAVRQILQGGPSASSGQAFAGEVSDLTRLYVLWRWDYGEARVPFDEARKLAQSCGVDLAREWGRCGFVSKEREFVRLLGPQRRKLDDLQDARELIDVLHRVLLLWEKGRRQEMVQALAASGYGRSEAFYRVAQAVSETLPIESKEKKLLDGFLAGRERVREEVGQTMQQERLWKE